MPDIPFDELAKQGNDLVTDKGATVWFKWTCVGCGSRQTFDKPNTLYTQGSCEECGSITDLCKHGGGILVLFPLNREAQDAVQKITKEGDSE